MAVTVLDVDLGLFLPAVVLLMAYFVPTLVAAVRNHHNLLAIALINIFLGGTIIGWFVALAMALSATDGDG